LGSLGSPGPEGKTGAFDGLLAADRATGGYSQAFPLAEGEAAFAADCRHELKAEAGPGGPGHMLKMLINLFFRKREALGQLQSGKGLLLEQLPDSLTDSVHVKPVVFPSLISVKEFS